LFFTFTNTKDIFSLFPLTNHHQHRSPINMTVSIDKLRSCLLDISQPVAQRTHAAFILRTKGDAESVVVLSEAVANKADSSLMRHELAYILGQIQNPVVCPLLSSILSDDSDDLLVRHESAEALGAIGKLESLPILEQFANHPAAEISETCQIAIDLIKWRQQGETAERGGYLSVDPAPALKYEKTAKSVEILKQQLMDPSLSLFHRYRAMFALRNMNSDAAAVALLDGFKDGSALFRHEVAYVLGQMQRRATVEGLTKVLRDESEHRMVRHEAAEALGAVGGEDVEQTLNEYINDKEQVVKESCHVALDTIEYWASGDFEATHQAIVDGH
jgi:deoxyhypusine monooxygenase